MINFAIFEKNNAEKYFHYQFMSYFIFYIFGVLLTKNKSPIITFLVLFIITIYIYFIHRLIHSIPKEWNIHTQFHHRSDINTNYLLSYIVETILNIMFFVSFYWIKILFKLDFIDNILIVYYCIAYTTAHMINYSIFHLGGNHAKHHEIKENVCNYGPDIMDHIFNTSCDGKFEDINHLIVNYLLAFFVTSCIYKIPVLSSN